MMFNFFIFGYVNDLDNLTAEILAKEALEIFLESWVMGAHVATDFKDEVASRGETVSADYPVELDGDILAEGASMIPDSAAVGKHLVKLNRVVYKALPFTDREKARSLKGLVEYFLAPMIRSVAQKADQIIKGEIYQSYPYSVGTLGGTIGYEEAVDAGTLMTEAEVPTDGRNLIVGPRIGGQVRKSTDFIDRLSLTDKSLLRTGVIGGINGFVVSETSSFATVGTTDTTVGAINKVGGHAAGETALTVDAFSAAIVSGSWCKIGGVPYRIASTTGGATPTVITLEAPGLRDAVADNAVVTIYDPALVNLVAGYEVGYEGGIVFDSVTPVLGQGVTLGVTGAPYSVIKVDGSTVYLNRPLETALADDDELFLMPGGNYGVGMHKNSIQLVNRPLALPGQNQGVDAYVASDGTWSIRVMRSYSHLATTEVVSVDFIMGIANLFPQYNVLFLG